MINVRFPPHLRRFIDVPTHCECEGATINELIDGLEMKFPGVAGYLVHENGKLRQHVNLFLDGSLYVHRDMLDHSIEDVDEVVIMQALSGG